MSYSCVCKNSLTRTNCAREEIKVKKRKKENSAEETGPCWSGAAVGEVTVSLHNQRICLTRAPLVVIFEHFPSLLSQPAGGQRRHLDIGDFIVFFFRVTQAWTMSMFDNPNFTVNLEHFWLSAWELFHLTKSKPRKAAQASGCEARAHWQGR